jgi:hypothetical protein
MVYLYQFYINGEPHSKFYRLKYLFEAIFDYRNDLNPGDEITIKVLEETDDS